MMKFKISGFIQYNVTEFMSKHVWRVTTVFHLPWLYSYLYLRPEKITILWRFICMRQKITIRCSDVSSVNEARTIAPVGLRGLRINLGDRRSLLVFASSRKVHSQIRQQLKTMLPHVPFAWEHWWTCWVGKEWSEAINNVPCE